MPVQDFALDPMGNHRVQVHWASESDPVTALLNGSVLGTLATPDERAAGKDFMLPEGSYLHVRFVNDQPQAFRNGYPLTIAPAIVEPASLRKRGGCLTTWLILNLVVISLFTILYFLSFLSSLSNDNLSLLPWAYIALGLIGCVGIVGVSFLLGWKKWGFYLVASYVLCNFALAFPLGLVNGNPRVFTPLVGLAILYFLLRRNDVWEQLT